MTLTIPTIPVMPAGYIATATDMNNLAACCTFVLTKPICHITDSAGSQAIGTSPTLISFAQEDIDTDGMHSGGAPSEIIVNTPGRYKIRYTIFGIGSTNPIISYCQSTTGTNNPLGSGVTHIFWAGYSNPFSGDGGGAGAGGLWPDYMYAGDYWQIYAVSSVGTGNSTQAEASIFSVEYVGIS